MKKNEETIDEITNAATAAETASTEATAEKPKTARPRRSRAKSNSAQTDKAKTDAPKTAKTKPNTAKPDKVNAAKAETDKVMTGKAKSDKVRIIPLGGLDKIGMNITAIEYEDSILVVDCGISFPNEEMLGIDLVIPDITYLKNNADKVRHRDYPRPRRSYRCFTLLPKGAECTDLCHKADNRAYRA